MNERKPKLLFVVNVDWFFLSHRLPIALEAQKQGYEDHLASAITDKQTTIESLGIIAHPLSLIRGKASPIATFRNFLELLGLFMCHRPDIVHLVTIKPVLLGGLAARIARIQGVVAAVTGLGFVFMAQGLIAQVRRLGASLLYRLALGGSHTYAIFQNTDDRVCVRRVTGLPESRTFLIRGSGVDLSRYQVRDEPATPFVVLLAARLLKDKGVREFVEAARLIKASTKDVRFCLVGSTDPDNPTSLDDAQIQRWVGEGLIEAWGHHDDMPDVLASAHIVVLPSYREGLPKVLIEAAACGRAVVTTDVPGCRDAITPNVAGLLVPVKDAAALARAIQSLLDDPEKRHALAKAGRALAESAFNIEDVVRRHMDIYATINNDHQT